MTDRPHALYRFYAADGALLYVGITADPGARWKTHSTEKPWWTAVASVIVEHYPDRGSVLEAERRAILAEKPLHNVVHNRGSTESPRLVPQLDRLAPIQVGDWAALGLRDGRCPVGEIVALDNNWLSLRLKEFLMGSLTAQIIALRWAEVERMELAYPEDSWLEHGVRRMDDEHLGEFQTAWQRARLLESDPVEMARREYRQELQQDRYEARRP